MRADEREQALLPLAALGAGLGEAGRDDAQRTDPLPERRLGRVEHLSAGNADHRQVDRIGALLDRAVSAHTGDRLAAAVHRIRRPGEVGLEDVPEELAADRAAPPRGPHHGHARGQEHPLRTQFQLIQPLQQIMP